MFQFLGSGGLDVRPASALFDVSDATEFSTLVGRVK